jgi:hypothetical protein
MLFAIQFSLILSLSSVVYMCIVLIINFLNNRFAYKYVKIPAPNSYYFHQPKADKTHFQC